MKNQYDITQSWLYPATWKLALVSMLMVVCWLAMSPAVAADTYIVNASGRFMGRDYSRTDAGHPVEFPLAHARVEIFNSNSDYGQLLDDYMGSGFTDEQGYFRIEGKGKDPWWSLSDQRPDVYARIALNDDEGVRVVNELDWVWMDNTPEHDHNNVSGEVWLGTFLFGSGPGEGGSRHGIYDGARRAYQSYRQIGIGEPPCGNYTIISFAAWPYGTPWTGLDTTRWPTRYHSGRVSDHEFGHIIRHDFDAPNKNSDHWLADVVNFTYARTHYPELKSNEGFAFNEGWAKYWADSLEPRDIAVVNPANLDFEVEGHVAYALSLLDQTTVLTSQGYPQLVGRRGMVEILRKNPGTIHSYREFKAAFDREYPPSNRASKQTMAHLFNMRAKPSTSDSVNDRDKWADPETQRQALEATKRQIKILRDKAAGLRADFTRLSGEVAHVTPDKPEYYPLVCDVILSKTYAELYTLSAVVLQEQMDSMPADDFADPEADWKVQRERMVKFADKSQKTIDEAFKDARSAASRSANANPSLRKSADDEIERLKQMAERIKKTPLMLPLMLEASRSTRRQVE